MVEKKKKRKRNKVPQSQKREGALGMDPPIFDTIGVATRKKKRGGKRLIDNRVKKGGGIY